METCGKHDVRDAPKQMLAKYSLAAIALMFTIMAVDDGRAMDRFELGNVLKAIPPNGPYSNYGTIVMRTKSRPAGVAPVVFAHWSHRSRYTCRVCHQELGISMRRGDTGITRREYLAGKYCGACHDGKTAFTVKDVSQAQCDRCHMKKKNRDELDKSFAAFADTLPLAPFGNGVDWSKSLKAGLIEPANGLKFSTEILKLPEKLRKPLKLGTKSLRSDVSFSHEDHFLELDCSSCHPDIFNIKFKSTIAFTMDSNIYGNFCGVCHMQVAFPMNDCQRCHATMNNARY